MTVLWRLTFSDLNEHLTYNICTNITCLLKPKIEVSLKAFNDQSCSNPIGNEVVSKRSEYKSGLGANVIIAHTNDTTQMY